MALETRKPDGTEGTATLEMTYNNGKDTTRFPGCIVENDDNLWHFIEPGIRQSADRKKFKTKYYFYTCDASLEEKIKAVTSCIVTCHRFSNPGKAKLCILNPMSSNNVAKVQQHIFIPCEFKSDGKFLKEHAKKIREAQEIGNTNIIIFGLSYACGKKGNIPKFIPLTVNHGQQHTIDYSVVKGDYKNLVEAGPVLLGDNTTVVGSFKKKEDEEISIFIFGKNQGDSESVSLPPIPLEEEGRESGHSSLPSSPIPPEGGDPVPSSPHSSPIPHDGEPEPGPSGVNQQSAFGGEQNDGSSDNLDGTPVAAEQQEYLINFFEKDAENIKILARFLDRRGSKVLKNYEHLADLLDAPPFIKAKCKSNTEHNPTLDLLQLPKVSTLSVKALVEKLRNISQNHEADKIEKKIPADQRAELSVEEAIDNYQELFEDVADRLNRLKTINWKILGHKLEFKRKELDQIELGCNPTERLLVDYAYATLSSDQLTLGRFRELLTAIDRSSVLQICGITEQDDSRSIKEVIPPQSEKMWQLCLELNKKIAGLKNWENLAYEWGISHEIYSQFKPNQKTSPTEILLKEWLVSERPQFTVNALCRLLGQISRNDAKRRLEEKLKEYSQI